MMNNREPVFSFSHLVNLLRMRFEKLSDPRNRLSEDSYPLVDVAMSGLAMFHFQDPSILQFQEALEKTERRSNLETLFHVAKVPKAAQMRTLLDGVKPSEVEMGFPDVFS